MGVVIRRWVWLESIGVVSGCFPHITYISLLHLYLLFFAAASLLLFSFCYYKELLPCFFAWSSVSAAFLARSPYFSLLLSFYRSYKVYNIAI